MLSKKALIPFFFFFNIQAEKDFSVLEALKGWKMLLRKKKKPSRHFEMQQ